jgi:hypothetical protein
MTDEPNFLNHHHQHEELEAEIPLLPELEALAAYLTADGAVWQSRLPDPARVAERIRSIPHESLLTDSEEGFPMSIIIDTGSAPGRSRPALPHRSRPALLIQRLGSLVAVVVVLALVGSMALAFYAARHPNGGIPPSPHPTATSTIVPAAFKVTSVTMSVTPASIAGVACGTNMTVTYTALFHFAPNSPGGTVQFTNTVNNGRGQHPGSITVGPGETTKTYAFTWSGALPTDHTYPEPGGVQVTSPNPLTSPLVGPTGQCTPVTPPVCGSNFTGPYQSTLTTAFGTVPLPPYSRTVPNDASGGVRGYDICSAGTASTIATYMQQNLPAYGWTFVSGSGDMESWKNSKGTINWSVANPLDWNINWRVPIG